MAILSVTLASIQAAVTIKMMEVKAQIDGSTNISLQYQNGYYVGSVSLPDGNHCLRIFAKDNAGNVNSSEVVYFSVFAQSPPPPIPELTTLGLVVASLLVLAIRKA